jgi:hypothetical protein
VTTSSEGENIARARLSGKRQRHWRWCIDSDSSRSLLCHDQPRRIRAAQPQEFVQPPVVKALHGQSEQYLSRGVNTNRPSRLQFAQSAANAEVFLVAKQGRVCRRVGGVHLQDFLLLGAFVEHRKS